MLAPTSSSNAATTNAAAAAVPNGAHQDPLSLPNNAKVVSLIMQSMGVQDYDPRVLPQLLEFTHRYTLDVLADAQLYAEHAGRSEIEVDDVRLAVEGKISHSFSTVPSREVLEEIANSRNAVPLPLMQEKYGIRLPPERNTITGINFNIVPQRVAPPPGSIVPQKRTASSSSSQPQASNSQFEFNAPPPVALPTGALPAPPPLIIGGTGAPIVLPGAAPKQNGGADDYDDDPMDE